MCFECSTRNDTTLYLHFLHRSLRNLTLNLNGSFILQAHCHAYSVKTFTEVVTASPLDVNVKTVLTSLCKLYAVHGIMENCGEFLQVKSVSCLDCI